MELRTTRAQAAALAKTNKLLEEEKGKLDSKIKDVETQLKRSQEQQLAQARTSKSTDKRMGQLQTMLVWPLSQILTVQPGHGAGQLEESQGPALFGEGGYQ